MKINEETTVSEEQVLFNKLRYEDQKLIINIMKTLQPCELSCEVEEEKKIPEKLDIEQDTPTSNYYIRNEYGTKCYLTTHSKMIADKLNEIINYLKSKGE